MDCYGRIQHRVRGKEGCLGYFVDWFVHGLSWRSVQGVK